MLALNYFYDKASGQYYYAYSVSARLTKKGMKQKVRKGLGFSSIGDLPLSTTFALLP